VTTRPRYLASSVVLGALVVLLVMSAAASGATRQSGFVATTQGEASTDTGAYTPVTATSAQIKAATNAQPYLVGLSKDYPAICDGVTDAKVEDTGAKTTSDRVDVGAPDIELEKLTPGTTYSYCFFIQNVGAKAIDFQISAVELVGDSDPNVKQQLVRPPKSVGTWLHPIGTHFHVEPGFRQYVPYTIVVPPHPPAGTSAGALEVVRLEGVGKDVAGAGFFISMLHKVLITFPGGTNKKLQVSDVRAPHVLTPENGHKSYVLRFDAHNVSNLVDVHHTDLSMSGLGRTISKTPSADSVLLPGGAEQVELRVKDMPWIGIYHPKAVLHGNGGDVQISLPWLFVMPPWPFVIAIIVALLLPVFVYVRHLLRSRAEWRAYLEEEEDGDGYEEWDDEDGMGY
jgi:hypothetical protein